MKYRLITFLTFAFISFNLSAQDFKVNSMSDFNPSHENKFTLGYGVNSSLLKATDLSGFQLSYARKLEHLWLDVSFSSHTGLFSKFSANNQTATGATDDDLIEQKNSLMHVGLGMGLETNYSRDFFNSQDTFEYVAANLGYYSYKEDFSGESFSGPGINAKFQLYRRLSEFFSVGANVNYHLAMVKRKALNDGESSSDRSLTLGFLTLGLDLNLYL